MGGESGESVDEGLFCEIGVEHKAGSGSQASKKIRRSQDLATHS